jgi:DNA-binding CsgD family transcriptional regulator
MSIYKKGVKTMNRVARLTAYQDVFDRLANLSLVRGLARLRASGSCWPGRKGDRESMAARFRGQPVSPVLLEALCRLSRRRFAEEGMDVVTIHIEVPVAEGDGEPVRLTWREREALQLIANGLSTAEVAQAMCITVQSVHNLLFRTYRKLKVSNRTAAVVHALRLGLIE